MNNRIKILSVIFLIITSSFTDQDNLKPCLNQNLIDAFGFKVVKKRNIRIEGDILHKKLTRKDYELLGLKRIEQIDFYKSEQSANKEFQLQYWEFDSHYNAYKSCELIDSLISSSSFFEKPPKQVVVHKNYILLLKVNTFNKHDIIVKAKRTLEVSISDCN